jgi:hypothetical protein
MVALTTGIRPASVAAPEQALTPRGICSLRIVRELRRRRRAERRTAGATAARREQRGCASRNISPVEVEIERWHGIFS